MTQEFNASQAIDHLDPKGWNQMPINQRLNLLHQVRENMKVFGEDLAKADSEMKNKIVGENIYSLEESLVGTVVPVGSTITASIELYESIQKGQMLQPVSIHEVKNSDEPLYDIQVFPQTAKDKIMYADRKDFLRVKGEPKQVNPFDKPTQIIGVLGAGNYSSSLEMVKAMFFDNAVVVHKPHHLNEATDKVWAKIFQPLVDIRAMSFCASDQGQALTKDDRLDKIYFTGGASTAQAIMQATDTPLISECGGNNPCIIVPGDKPWSQKELDHQAMQIATMAKLNGGAVCGRPQTLVTSKNWPQREAFLSALKKAISDETPAAASYYPGSKDVFEQFMNNHLNAEVLKPENGQHNHSDFLLITDAGDQGFAVKNEAFCQILDEVALDTPANAKDFLPKAVDFCNNKLLGTLGSSILIDDATIKNHQETLDQAITDMRYGGIAINTMPPFIFLNPYLTWGGNEEGQQLVSGYGNFGNLLGYENVEKSIIFADFMSPGHMINANIKVQNSLSKNMAKYALDPSWMNLTKLATGALLGKCKNKDF